MSTMTDTDWDGIVPPNSPQLADNDDIVFTISRKDLGDLVAMITDAAAIIRYLAPTPTGSDFGTRLRRKAEDLRRML